MSSTANTIGRARPTARKKRPGPSPSSTQSMSASALKAQAGGPHAGGPHASRLPHLPSDVRGTVADVMGRHRTLVVALLALTVAAVMLYAPVRAYYVAWRTNGVLQAQSDQMSEESAQLEGDINDLMTEDGIKDEARRRGYVEEGETRIVVEGIDEEDAAATEEAVEEIPWYLGIGDFVFQYEEGQ